MSVKTPRMRGFLEGPDDSRGFYSNRFEVVLRNNQTKTEPLLSLLLNRIQSRVCFRVVVDFTNDELSFVYVPVKAVVPCSVSLAKFDSTF